MKITQVAVIGLGRFGTTVATTLYQMGHDVLAIDVDPLKVQELAGQVTYAVAADASDESSLKELGIEKFEYAVVAIGSNTEASIMVSVLLKSLQIDVVVARAVTKLQGETLDRIEVDKVVYPETDMGRMLAHDLFLPGIEQYMELTSTYGISKIKVPTRFVSQTLKNSNFNNLRDRYGVALIAIQRGEDIILNPDENQTLTSNDTLIIAGPDEKISDIVSPTNIKPEN
ncbi:MAG: potassium channel family protein [Dehalococcoidia bacterium]